MEAGESSTEAVLDQLGMTAHGRSRGGALHLRKKSWPARYQTFNPSRLSRQSLSQKRIPDEALSLRRVVSQTLPDTKPIESSLPTSLPSTNNDQDRSEIIAGRRRKTISFLQELQSKEHLRLVEARRKDEGKSLTEQSVESDVTTEGAPVQTSLLFEQTELGPQAHDPHEEGSEIHPRYSSSATSDQSVTLADSPPIELDGNPVSDIIELPAEGLDDHIHVSYEYGDARFNTLPGESYPLADRKPSIEPLDLGTLTEDLFNIDAIEREAFKELVQPDVDPRTGLPFEASVS